MRKLHVYAVTQSPTDVDTSYTADELFDDFHYAPPLFSSAEKAVEYAERECLSDWDVSEQGSSPRTCSSTGSRTAMGSSDQATRC
jgi:hypothetical protein